ncbi:MAG: DNA polymerase domain-containing protein, partial [Bacillota bacterium]|nr:DNA polymerase domain-containing protein [Bacillota bacterium]
PSICLSYNIKPHTDVLSAFPAVLKVLTERRLAAKGSLKTLPPDGYEFKATDALQNSLKILINSFYGMLGTSGLYFSDSEASNDITTMGQEILLKMVANVERTQGNVIEIDTDGIYFTLPEGTMTAIAIICLVAEGLPPGIRVDYDGHYDYMYSYASKNYLLVQNGTLIRKGVVFRSRRLFGLQSEFIIVCVDKLIRGDITGLAAYYRQTAQRIRAREIELESVITYLTVDQTMAEYEAGLKSQSQRSRPLDLIASRPDRDRWTLRSKIYYYHAGNGEIKLTEDFAQDIDSTYYLELLRKSAEKFLYIFPPQDWYRIFSETPLSDEEARSIQPWSFEPRQAPAILSEYERVVKGDFQLRLF